jgi:hypothetical protein
MYCVFYAILFYFADYGIPLSQIKIVLFILANRKCLIRWRCCINIVFIFAGQWKARVICGVLILENYPWCVLPLQSKCWKRDRLLEWKLKRAIQSLLVYDKEHLYFQASILTFVRLSGTSENWRRTSRSCITVVRRDKWKNQIPKRAGTTDKSISTGIKYWVCCIKESCLIYNLSIIYFD